MATQNTDIVTAIQNNGKILGQIQAALAAITVAIAAAFPPPINGSTSWSPGSVTSGSRASTTITVAGVSLGYYAIASLGVDLQGQVLEAYVSAANTVTLLLTNDTGGSINLGAVTATVRTFAP